MKDLKRKPSTIRLKIQKYMDRVSGDESKPPQTPDSEPITEESDNELVSSDKILDKNHTLCMLDISVQSLKYKMVLKKKAWVVID